MRILSAVCAVGALFLASSAANGQAIRPIQKPQSTITEFRGYSFIDDGLEDDIWRLASDGHATMVYNRRGGDDGECREGGGCEGSDDGTWSRSSGQICVNWRVRRELSGCYTIERVSGTHVRLVGPVTFEGTIEGE